MALSEGDKDRIAEMWRRNVNGDPQFVGELRRDDEGWYEEDKLGRAVEAAFGLEGHMFLMALVRAVIAHHDELGPDPVIEAIDAAEARGGQAVKRIPGEHL